MFNKYPVEFEEMYQKVVVDKEDMHLVIPEYKYIMENEKIGACHMVLHLGKYVTQRRRTCEVN